MNKATFTQQNIKTRLRQAVKISKGYWNFMTKSPRQVGLFNPFLTMLELLTVCCCNINGSSVKCVDACREERIVLE